jgi:hypothetical protein
VRFDFLIGLVLGLTLPWISSVGLLAAVVTAILFLGLSIITLFESKIIALRRRRIVRRRKIRDWFLHFSVTTGFIGIITTLLSIVVPPFLKLSLGYMVPLAFDSLSVLSALLEFTLPSTPYNVIFALIFELVHRRNEKNLENEILAGDIDEIADETAHSRFEVLDAVESLIEEGLVARKQNSFALSQETLQLLRLNYEEICPALRIQCHHIDEQMELVAKNAIIVSKRDVDISNHLRDSMSDLKDEYGFLVDANWIIRNRKALSELLNRA